ncbi:hypothetical protein pdul_cds_530 [Pandoravirus dulcis]|uniref:Uncharacterized protein n=1 Tax=Pandoravirus dulcis TaxID=1349409 RepID=S4VXL1_9VIRU|nr:hypothetical protein pdul_cds_530 [Pandoravirus dulcis]AGO82629.1 hypothetical protein pdul_cds_530 [Pandoravirus dulcis]
MTSEAATTTRTGGANSGKRIKPAKVTEILEAYRAVGVAWDDLVEPVQDALIQDLMRYYDRWCKCVCRACGCQSKDHMGARNGCPAIGNTRPLSIVRIIDLCCNAAHEKREVSKAVRDAMRNGHSPLADPSVTIQYTRPHYEAADPEYLRKKKEPSASRPSKASGRRRQRAADDSATEVVLDDGDTSSVPATPLPSAPPSAGSMTAPAPAETQVQAMAQQMAAHLGAALAEANKRTESNNQAIAAALNLLGSEVQSLRAENEAIRSQAAQVLEASSRRTDSAAPGVGAKVDHVALAASVSSSAAPSVARPSAALRQQKRAPVRARPSAPPRSRDNIFQQRPTQQKSTPAFPTAAPSPLYPTIGARTMAPHLASLQGRVH